MKFLLILFVVAVGYVAADRNEVVWTEEMVQDVMSRPSIDAELTVPELITKYGYIQNSYKVTTRDGYILGVHRMYSPHGRPIADRPVVFLMHGLLSSSADWVIMGPGKGLAYILADAGYDVWMGNARGNTYSRAHRSYTDYSGEDFWYFSWHEIGKYDLPAMIDLALNTTGQKQVIYVGHSQGSTSFFVMASEIPEYNQKIKAMFALAPVAYMKHLISPMLQLASSATMPLSLILKLFGVHEFLPSSDLIDTVGATFCHDDALTQVLCSNVLFLLCGFNKAQLNTTALPTIFAHIPAGASTRQLIHYGQEISSGKFRRYDHGLVSNLIQYDSLHPPKYDLSRITAPVHLFHSDNDWMAAVRDVKKLYSELGNPVELYRILDGKWNHLDFTWGIDAKELVYDKIVNTLKKTTAVVFAASVVLQGNAITAWSMSDIGNYFGSSTQSKNRFGLDVIPEYKLEKHTFYTSLESATNGSEEILLYRIPGGPKSPPKRGKQTFLIQHGVLCDVDRCNVNQPIFAISYLLVDQGYDVWLGQCNFNDSVSLSENEEKKRLAPVAKYIMAETDKDEISVMGNFDGSLKIFGMTANEPEPDEEQSTFSRWLEKIPGVTTAKKWYNQGRNYISTSYDKVVHSFDDLGRRIDYVIDDLSIRELKKKVLNSWGMLSSAVGPTLNIDDFSKMIDDPEVHLSTPELIRKYGYETETHTVETEDGFILTVHRIAGGKKYPPGKNKPAIILQHGILCSSADWVIMGPSKSLGYILADHGYDVWLGNSRGNTYSKRHKNLTSADAAFWDFSWHEMGLYDVPAVIDYVLNETKMSNLSYVGHSQGATQLLVALSERPEYNRKINFAAIFAPIAYAGNMRSPIVTPFARISTPLYFLFKLVGVNNFLPTNAFLSEIGRDICESRSVLQVVCSNTLFLATGYDSSQMNLTMLPVILGHVPAGASTKQFVHYAQLYNSKKFRQFDYLIPYRNRQKYNQSEPLEYNLRNIEVPMAIFYASNDLLADYTDVERLAGELPNVAMLHRVSLENFNHVDFLYALDAPTLVYHQLIDSLRDHQDL
ncbi:uncharacterized protein LOC105694084 [Athalia rosae]|uniref:uncharacterized protein LOC105694084 n=1 Tax=Athalia rosae TaxID=37344 RepID=UPI0020337E40|nr:uncharacterized protein LOC105694084 [Athalia rosae]